MGTLYYARIIYDPFVTINPILQSMKPEIYAAKKAIVAIPIAMMRMIRSSLVIPANMTQDRGYFV